MKPVKNEHFKTSKFWYNFTVIEGCPLSELKLYCHGPVHINQQNFSFIEKSNVLCPLFVASFKRHSIVGDLEDYLGIANWIGMYRRLHIQATGTYVYVPD